MAKAKISYLEVTPDSTVRLKVHDYASAKRVLKEVERTDTLIISRRIAHNLVLDYLAELEERMRAVETGTQRLLLQAAELVGCQDEKRTR